MELAAFYRADVNSSLLVKEYKSHCSVIEQLKKDGIKLKTDEEWCPILSLIRFAELFQNYS